MINMQPNNQEFSSYATHHSTMTTSWTRNYTSDTYGSADRSRLRHSEDVFHNPSTMGSRPTNDSELKHDERLAESMRFMDTEHARSFGSMVPPVLPPADRVQEYASLLGNTGILRPENHEQSINHYGEWDPQETHNSEHFEFRPTVDYTAPFTAPGAPQDMAAHNNYMRRPTWPPLDQRNRVRRQRSTPNYFGNDFTNPASDHHTSSQHPFPHDSEEPSMLESGLADTMHPHHGRQTRPDSDPEATPSDGDFVCSPSPPPATVRHRSRRHRSGHRHSARHRSERGDSEHAVEEHQSPEPDINRQTNSPAEAKNPSPSASPAPRPRKPKAEDPQIPRWAAPISERQSSGEQRGVTGLRQPYVYESELRQIRRGYYSRPKVFKKLDPKGILNLSKRVRITPQEKEALMRLRPGWDIKKGPSKHHKTKEERDRVGLKYMENLKKRAANDPEEKKRKRDDNDESGDCEQSQKRVTRGKRVQYENEEDEEEESEEYQVVSTFFQT